MIWGGGGGGAGEAQKVSDPRFSHFLALSPPPPPPHLPVINDQSLSHNDLRHKAVCERKCVISKVASYGEGLHHASLIIVYERLLTSTCYFDVSKNP